ncbi:uncharacterized protein cubi_00384 [Cryptosporidium ubiquitum]|uniref:Uncharacterized protein n=1 Tax=Cryptosporidium ubiquitum TaxID=857276 RepID=A0A1J4MHT9_9CRYT|nr:uncharacterized protein cubi_00384 [Cryptosporidium ubiquitum]OII72389.1 hypothetical protein cubi_00384 [Cryptosporidium ubiquitum]
MGLTKFDFIFLVLFITFFSNPVVNHDKLISLEVFSDFSLIKLRSPRRLLRSLCCCSSCKCKDGCSSCGSEDSVVISGPTDPKHVWSLSGEFGGFKQNMEVVEPRTEDNQETNEEETNDNHTNESNNDDKSTSEDSEEGKSCCCCKNSSSSSSSSSPNNSEIRNPYDE